MTFQTNQDKQLWLIDGPAGEGPPWVAPLYVTHGVVKDQPEIGPVVMVSTTEVWVINSVLKQLRQRIDPLALGVSDRGRIIPLAQFETLKLRKAEGITPQFYLRTGGQGQTDDRTQTVNGFEGTDAPPVAPGEIDETFLAWVHKESAPATLSEMRVIWAAIVQKMPEWMVLKQKPVDFGWCRLHAFPFRANWKQILLAKFPRIWRWLEKPMDRHKLEISTFAVEARSSDLLAVIRKKKDRGFIRWSAELQVLPSFYEYSDQIEQDNARHSLESTYLRRVGGLVNRAWPRMVECLRSFVADTITPCGDVVSDRSGGPVRLVKHWPGERVRQKDSDGWEAAVVSDDCTGIVGMSKEEPQTGEGEAPYVQEMPIVRLYKRRRPDDGDVRPSGGDDPAV